VLSGHKTGSQPRPFHRRICIPARPPEAAPQWHIKYQKPKAPRFWYTIFGQTRKSPAARRIGTPIPGPGRIGNRGFPVSRPNRESGIPSPIPGKKSGNRGNRESDFLSDEYQLQWTRNILSREYHASAFTGSMRLLFRVRDSEREHAAVSDEHQLQ